jgi:CBS domain-containing protein
MKAGDVALPVPTPTPRTLSLVSAIDRLLREANRFLLAQDDFKRPVGVFTERDVLRIAARTLPPGTPYQPPPTAPIVASPSDRSGDVYRRMEQHHIRHLPVLEAGRVIGVVFRRDLLREDAFSLREVRLADLGAMSPAVTAPVGLTLKQVAEKLFDDRLGCLPLLNPDGSLATIATITDVIRTFRARIP